MHAQPSLPAQPVAALAPIEYAEVLETARKQLHHRTLAYALAQSRSRLSRMKRADRAAHWRGVVAVLEAVTRPDGRSRSARTAGSERDGRFAGRAWVRGIRLGRS